MKKLFAITAIAALTGCAAVDEFVFTYVDPHPKTLEQRQRFNSLVGAPECVFDKTGNAINRDAGIGCADWRWINHPDITPRGGFNVIGSNGVSKYKRYIKTPHVDPADIASVEIPEGVTVVWYDQVSKAEATCAQLTVDRWKAQGLEGAAYYNELALLEYPPGCYDRAFKIIYAVYGDKPVLEHEISHHYREIADDQ